MTLLELWKSTVTNLRALLGFTPKPRPRSASPSVPLVKRSVASSASATPHTRKSLNPVDMALDEAAFAAVNARRSQPAPEPSLAVHAPDAPSPEVTWTRQGISQEPPVLDVPDSVTSFVPGHPSSEDGFVHGNGDEAGHNGDGENPDDENPNGENPDDEGVALTTLLESLLFVAAEPVDPRQLAQTLDQPLEVIEMGLAELADYYQRTLRGLRLQRFNNKVQLVTTPAAAPFIEIFLNLDSSTRLSSPALETLAVIAYRQPVTRAQIEAVRGVDCAGVLRSLVQRGLVVEVGRMESMGRPILYGVTEQFMHHFGLVELGELPPLEESEADRLWAVTVLDDPEAGESATGEQE
jgi:segregation and condensation protein B